MNAEWSSSFFYFKNKRSSREALVYGLVLLEGIGVVTNIESGGLLHKDDRVYSSTVLH